MQVNLSMPCGFVRYQYFFILFCVVPALFGRLSVELCQGKYAKVDVVWLTPLSWVSEW